MILDVLALVVLGVLVAAAIALVVALGRLPGTIARRRGHAQADAITALGWVGVLTLGLAWPVALVWAYTRPARTAQGETSIEELDTRLAALERKGVEGTAP